MKGLNRSDYPYCPRCGTQFISNGANRWRCPGCGYGPSKVKCELEKPNYTERAPCPICGKHYGILHGINEYQCGACGKCYQRDWQEKLEAGNDMVIPAMEAVEL